MLFFRGILRKAQGLSMLELVFALGLLFVSSGGVMSILVAGAGWPKRTAFATMRDSLAKVKLDELRIAGSAPTAAAYSAFPNAPDYDFQVDVQPSAFDPAASVLKVTVRGPRPMTVNTQLSALYVSPNGMVLFTQYGCNGCHALGTSPMVDLNMDGLADAPNLSTATMTAGMNDRNSQPALAPPIPLDSYIAESIRYPSKYLVTGFPTALMAGSPNLNDMPQEDLNAIRAYIKTF